jgi:hypothetical protein
VDHREQGVFCNIEILVNITMSSSELIVVALSIALSIGNVAWSSPLSQLNTKSIKDSWSSAPFSDFSMGLAELANVSPGSIAKGPTERFVDRSVKFTLTFSDVGDI